MDRALGLRLIGGLLLMAAGLYLFGLVFARTWADGFTPTLISAVLLYVGGRVLRSTSRGRSH
jgi:membrane protein implicated in regulation of membrane protease activity